MKFRLGYVAISLSLEEICHFHTITYTSYQKLGVKKGNKKLNEIINLNLTTLETILKYNTDNNIHFYRINHHIVPLASHKNVIFNYIKPYKKRWLDIGKYIKENNIRIDSHPDQFCVLNSINEEVINNSKEILNFNKKLFNALNISGKVILHIGSSINGKEESIQRFKNNFKSLPATIKEMILLENDDKIYNLIDTLTLCEELNIPMVLDYHHYRCNNQKEKRTHSTYIILKDFLKFINIVKEFNQDIDIMLECKGKDEALLRLSRQLKQIQYIKCIDNSTFQIEKDYKN